MNLLQAISLGGGGRDLQGNDSTSLICHVQLVIMAVDWILNIVADNFLQDPLVILIIFICQALLLIVGLIFYLMASANQAMKGGIHEKLLRHHQVTVFLWTIYFSTLVCWYIWTLKRSWPSAGEHFSFTFSDPIRTHVIITDSSLSSSSTSTSTSTEATTISGPKLADNTLEIVTTTSAMGLLTSPDPLDLARNDSILPHNDSLVENLPDHDIRKRHQAFLGSYSRTLEALVVGLNSTGDNPEDWEKFKFFWSPGFIALYVLERSVSLLFYVGYILGTLHIVNAHLLDEDSSPSSTTSTGGVLNLQNNNNEQSRPHKRINFRSNLFSNPPAQETFYMESDSNIDDNFIRQLEDQDPDPFDNEQFNYQYKVNTNLNLNERAKHHQTHQRQPHRRNLDNDPSDSDNNKSTRSSEETDEPPSYGREKRRRNKRDSGGKNRGKVGMKDARVSKSTKGALKNMVMTANTSSSSMMEQQVVSSNNWLQDFSEDNGNYPAERTFPKSHVFSPPQPQVPPRRGGPRRDFTTVENKLVPATSSSMDTMATGSTDELLVAEVITRDGEENRNVVRTLRGYHNDFGQSDESVYN